MLEIDDDQVLAIFQVVGFGVLMISCHFTKNWAAKNAARQIHQIQTQQVVTEEAVIKIVRLQKSALIAKGLPNILETLCVCLLLGQTMTYSPKATVCVAIGLAFVRSLLKLLFHMYYPKPQPDHTDMKVDKADTQKTLTPHIPTSLDKSKEDAPTTLTPDSTKMESDKSKEDAPTTLAPDSTNMESDKSKEDAPTISTPDSTNMESDKSKEDAPTTLAPDSTNMESDKSKEDAPTILTPDSTNMESDKSKEDAPTTSPTPDQSTKTDMPAVSVYTDVCGDTYEFLFTLSVQFTLYFYVLEWVFKQEKLAYESGSQEQIFLSRGTIIAVVCRRFSETFHNGEFKPFWEHVWLKAKAGEFRNTPAMVWGYVLFRFVSSWLVNDVLALSTLFLLPVILSQADDQIEFVKDATAVLFIAEMDNMKKHFCTTIRMEIVKNSNKTMDSE